MIRLQNRWPALYLWPDCHGDVVMLFLRQNLFIVARAQGAEILG